MDKIRQKIKRKLSMKEENPNFDEYNDTEDVDDDFHGNLSRDAEKAEQDNLPQGRPNSMLNRLISHGNKRTEDQITKEAADREAAQQSQSAALSSSKDQEFARQQALSSANK